MWMALAPKAKFVPEKILGVSRRIAKDLEPQGATGVEPMFGFPNGKAPARWYMLISGKLSNSKKFKPVPDEIDGFPIVHSKSQVKADG
jgi:hypothetical protein